MSILTEQLAAARAKLLEAQGRISSEDRDELEARAELARINSETEEEIEKARGLIVDRAMDDARTRLGADAKIYPVVIKGFPDWFIVKPDPKAHTRWLNAATSGTPDQPVDKQAISRAYALAVVDTWNGKVNGDDPEFTAKLSRFINENPGIAQAITNAAIEGVGVLTIARKS